MIQAMNRSTLAAMAVNAALSATAIADVTGLEVEYNGLFGGRHVWSVYAVSNDSNHVMLQVRDHRVTAGSMSGVQHNDFGGGTWNPQLTIITDQIANDSFVTVTGLWGASARTNLDPSFDPSTGSVIPEGAGWLTANPASNILFTGGRIKIMQVAGETYGSGPGGLFYTGMLTVGYKANPSATTMLYAENLTYWIGGACVAQSESASSGQLVPYSFSNPQEWLVSGIRPSSQGATLTITARGQLGTTTRFLTVKADGVTIATNVFGAGSGASACSATVSIATFEIPPAQFAELTGDGALAIRVEPSLNATSDGCANAVLQVQLDYERDLVDCDGNGVDDECVLEANDCNQNQVLDSCDITSGASADVNANGRPDECEADCNGNDLPDPWEISQGLVPDCNQNGIPDACDIARGGTSTDVDANGVPDDCKADCNNNDLPDAYEIAQGLVADCDNNAVPDSCQIATAPGVDCNSDGLLDACGPGTSDSDCDNNAVPDSCQIAADAQLDCNTDGVLDSCQGGPNGSDCDGNGIPDICDIANGAEDKNDNGRLDSCELRYGDLNLDGQVNGTDLAGLLAVWGLSNPPYGDLDGDGQVGGSDLSFLLARWGPVP
jgi:hypothetical protein